MSKKILVISPTPSHPQNAGNRMRIYKLLLNLKEMGHDVYFLYINTENAKACDEELMQKSWGDKFYFIPYKLPQRRLTKKVFRKLKTLFAGDHKYLYSLDEWYDNSLNEFFIKLAKKKDFDVVIVEYVFFSKALECFGRKVLKIIDTHDIFANRHQIYLRKNQQPRWYSTTAEEEVEGLNRADVIIAIQQKEKDWFSKITSKKVITVGHTVSLHRPTQRLLNNHKLLFVGSHNPINVHGINYFIKSILPQIRTVFPNLQLILAGKVCEKVEDFDICVKLGEIENIKNAYDMANLVINPVLLGTGLNIKTIEALGYSKPLVTTSIGSKGLENGIDKAFLVSDDPEDFSLSIIKVLSDVKIAASLSEKAYEFAKKWNEESLRELANILI
jgi:glycosyltransferase involved in cell wall biosynthesis